jgi:hypothetical protein
MSRIEEEEQQCLTNKSIKLISDIGYTLMMTNEDRISANTPILAHEAYKGITKAVYNRVDPSKALSPSHFSSQITRPQLCEVLECNEVATVLCNVIHQDNVLAGSQCSRRVCNLYHSSHASHSLQLFKNRHDSNLTLREVDSSSSSNSILLEEPSICPSPSHTNNIVCKEFYIELLYQPKENLTKSHQRNAVEKATKFPS